jgi:hypothetical protein|eukprot:COSAG06_NODE_2463_length_6830_cov_17.476155_8_plen_107_part_00
MALNHCYKKAKWLISLFEELGWKERFMPVPMELRGDNKQAGRWGRENMITNGNRFIERMYKAPTDTAVISAASRRTQTPFAPSIVDATNYKYTRLASSLRSAPHRY